MLMLSSLVESLVKSHHKIFFGKRCVTSLENRREVALKATFVDIRIKYNIMLVWYGQLRRVSRHWHWLVLIGFAALLFGPSILTE
jgi:hypothetical protein